MTKPNAVDPSCGISRDGAFYAGSIHDQRFADGQTDSVLNIDRSRNGRSWEPSTIQPETRGIDRAYITIDTARSSKKVYVDAYHASRTPSATALFFPSFDAGATFEKIVSVNASTFKQPWYFPGNGVVAPDGTCYVLMAELDNTKRNMSYRTDPDSAPSGANAVLDIFRSRDDGRSFAQIATMKGVYYDWRVPQLSLPQLAVDLSKGSYRGRLYAVWPDARLDRRTHIFFSSSSDGGQTWASPRIVDDGALITKGNPNNFMPTVAVTRHGIVGVSWYDRRDNPDDIGYWVRFSASLDGGEHWLPSQRVSTSPNLASTDTRKNGGDTAGLTADADGTFHAFWIDNRTGIPQMWTAPIAVRK